MERREGKEETLDPEEWDNLIALGHRMLDDMMNHHRNIATHPFSMPTKEAVKEICVSLTSEGEGEEKVYEIFQKYIRQVPYLELLTAIFHRFSQVPFAGSCTPGPAIP